MRAHRNPGRAPRTLDLAVWKEVTRAIAATRTAATFGPEAFERMHARLLAAYFGENQDITAPDTLVALWSEVGLPAGEFARAGDQALVETVVREHNAAFSLGLTGVPAVQLAGNDVPVTGALPYESYRRWVERASGAR